MASATISLTCASCGRPFKRRRSDYESVFRRGQRRFYCNRDCQQATWHKEQGLSAWHQDETEWLRANYQSKSIQQLADELGRSYSAVACHLSKNGLTRMRPWTEREYDFVRMHSKTMSHAEIGAALGRTKDAIEQVMSKKLRLTKSPMVGDTASESQALHYYKIGCVDSEIAEIVGRAPSTINRWRERNELKPHGWNERARRRLSRIRKGDARYRRFLEMRRLSEHQSCLEQGWRQARTIREAQVLDLLEDGSKSKSEIGRLLGYKQTSEGYYVVNPLNRLVKRKIVVREARRDGSRNLVLYSLATSVQRVAPEWHNERIADIDLNGYDRLVCKLALKYGASRKCLHESNQYLDGWDGLVMARERFRPELGFKFMTFAYRYVEGHIINGIKKRGRIGRDAHVTEFSQMGLEDDDRNPADLAVSYDPEPGNAEEASWCLSFLDERSKKIVRMVVMEDRPMEEVGREMDPPIMRERVRQIVDAALAEMRERAS